MSVETKRYGVPEIFVARTSIDTERYGVPWIFTRRYSILPLVFRWIMNYPKDIQAFNKEHNVFQLTFNQGIAKTQWTIVIKNNRIKEC